MIGQFHLSVVMTSFSMNNDIIAIFVCSIMFNYKVLNFQVLILIIIIIICEIIIHCFIY